MFFLNLLGSAATSQNFESDGKSPTLAFLNYEMARYIRSSASFDVIMSGDVKNFDQSNDIKMNNLNMLYLNNLKSMLQGTDFCISAHFLNQRLKKPTFCNNLTIWADSLK